MLVRGQRAPVRGVVCMDSTVLDVGHIPGVTVGDEVVVLGQQGNETITAGELAERAGTIVYEIIARLGSRPQRIYLNLSERGG
jgi:alanine racemase